MQGEETFNHLRFIDPFGTGCTGGVREIEHKPVQAARVGDLPEIGRRPADAGFVAKTDFGLVFNDNPVVSNEPDLANGLQDGPVVTSMRDDPVGPKHVGDPGGLSKVVPVFFFLFPPVPDLIP